MVSEQPLAGAEADGQGRVAAMAEPAAGGPAGEPEIHSGEQHHGGLASRLNWLRAGVLGANDGIVSTAGLVVGVAGAPR